MNLDPVAYFFLLGFFCFLVFICIKNYRSENNVSHFFNAGGKLHWITIGASLLGTNLAFEYVLSSASNGYIYGLAYGSYEWAASFVMILTALYIIPKFMRIGILTLPEYLEYRFSKTIRIMMAVLFVVLQFGMIISFLIANGLFMEKLFDIHRLITISVIALIGGGVVLSGGMSSKIKLDTVVFFLFFLAGLLLLVLVIYKAGGINNFYQHAGDRLKIVLPADHEVIPWTSVFIGGLWLLHIQYWAFFQPITQTALASGSLSQTQKGFLLAASAKLITPLIMIVPGIAGYELYSGQMQTAGMNPDMVLPVLIKNVVPYGLGGIVLLGYLSTMFGAYTGYLSATSSLIALDLLSGFFLKNLSHENKVKFARLATVGLVILSITCAYLFVPDGLLFSITQTLLLAVAPVSASVFLFAIYSKRSPSVAAMISLIAGIPLFFILKSYMHISLLNLSGLVFLIICALMLIIRLIFPLNKPVILPEKFAVKFERNLVVVIWSIFVLTCVFSIYAILI